MIMVSSKSYMQGDHAGHGRVPAAGDRPQRRADGHFAAIMDEAMSARLDPPFDPYASSINFLLAS